MPIDPELEIALNQIVDANAKGFTEIATEIANNRIQTDQRLERLETELKEWKDSTLKTSSGNTNQFPSQDSVTPQEPEPSPIVVEPIPMEPTEPIHHRLFL